MALSRSSIGKLAVLGYPGHIFVCKLRYGYGHQEHIEKLEILHSWYSDLNAFLPVVFAKKPGEYAEKRITEMKDGQPVQLSIADLMEDVGAQIDRAYDQYQPVFEGQTMNTQEKTFIKSMRAIKERLDTITAESKIIEGIRTDDSMDVFG